MNRVKNLLCIPLLAVCLNGCIYFAIGGVGALGGYIASPDAVEGLAESSTAQAWDTAAEVVSIMGLIESKNEAGGIIKARINGAAVTVMIMEMSSSSVKLTVKARKHYLPKISLAQDVFVKIMSRMNE